MRPTTRLRSVLAGLDRIADLCGRCNDVAQGVSHWSVGNHIEHVLKVDRAVLSTLRSTTPPTAPTRGPSLGARAMLILGWIPRGRAKAPPSFFPEMTDYAQLRPEVAEVTTGYAALEPLVETISADPTRFPHPILGGLTRLQWLRFIEVHQRHHWKIMRDICGRPDEPGDGTAAA